MTKASKGLKKGGRRRLARGLREKFTVERLVKAFKVGEEVRLVASPASQKGFPPMRHLGSTGTIIERRGRHYMVALKSGGKGRRIIAGPESLVAME